MGTLTQTGLSLDDTTTYKLGYSLSGMFGGTVTGYVGGTAGVANSTNGSHEDAIVSSAPLTQIQFVTSSDFVGVIDNVTLVLVSLGSEMLTNTDFSSGGTGWNMVDHYVSGSEVKVGVVAMLHFNGTDGDKVFTDENGNTWTPDSASNTLSNEQIKFGTTSAKAPFGLGLASTLPQWSTSFTWEAWVYMPSVASVQTLLSSSTANVGFTLVHSGTTFRIREFGSIDRIVHQDVTDHTNRWIHVAVVSEAGTGYIYVDGVKSDTSYSTTAVSSDTSPDFTIGGDGSTTSNDMDGYIDDVRLVDTAIYTIDFTPPTSEF